MELPSEKQTALNNEIILKVEPFASILYLFTKCVSGSRFYQKQDGSEILQEFWFNLEMQMALEFLPGVTAEI